MDIFSVSTHTMSRLSQNYMCLACERKAHAWPMELSHVPNLMLPGVVGKAQIFRPTLLRQGSMLGPHFETFAFCCASVSPLIVDTFYLSCYPQNKVM